MYLGNKEIPVFLGKYCIISFFFFSYPTLHNLLFYFPQNAIRFVILSFPVLKFKYQPGHLKVSCTVIPEIHM